MDEMVLVYTRIERDDGGDTIGRSVMARCKAKMTGCDSRYSRSHRGRESLSIGFLYMHNVLLGTRRVRDDPKGKRSVCSSSSSSDSKPQLSPPWPGGSSSSSSSYSESNSRAA